MSLLSDFGAAADADDDDDGVAAGELSTLSWPALLLLLNNNTSVQSHSTKSYTIQYKICKAPCCRGFRGAGEQVS